MVRLIECADAQAAQCFDLAELYDLLAGEYEQLGRVDDALDAMRQALAAGRDGQPDGRCRLAEILLRVGRTDEAAELWAQVKADTPNDVWLYNNAGIEYANAGDHATALDWLTEGLTLAIEAGDPDELVDQLAEIRAGSLSALRRQPDEVQRRAEQFLAAERTARQQAVEEAARQREILRPAAVSAAARRLALAWAWFPAEEYAEALRRWPDLAEPGGPAEGGRDHAGYSRAMQAKLVQAADAGTTGSASRRSASATTSPAARTKAKTPARHEPRTPPTSRPPGPAIWSRGRRGVTIPAGAARAASTRSAAPPRTPSGVRVADCRGRSAPRHRPRPRRLPVVPATHQVAV